MIGVSSRTSNGLKREWLRFVIGYALGATLAVIIVGAALHTAQDVATAAPTAPRFLAFAGVAVALALRDLQARPVCLRRQTPQHRSKSWRAVPLGFVYGVDVGSSLSTFKVTSLVWAVLAGTLLVAPDLSPFLIMGSMAAVQVMSLALRMQPRAWLVLQDFAVVDRVARTGRTISVIALMAAGVIATVPVIA